MTATIDSTAFPRLTQDEIAVLKQIAQCVTFNDGDYVFKAGQTEVDLFIVHAGSIAVFNPTSSSTEPVVIHEIGQFTGDIDILTGRPVLCNGIARGTTQCCRISNKDLRMVLTRIPHLSEKLLEAFQLRRRLLQESGPFGLRIIGYAYCHHTTLIREFLHKNFVPHTFVDVEVLGESGLKDLKVSADRFPVVHCVDETDLVQPTPREVAEAAGVWRHCPASEVDVAIIGAGPGGIAAAVYAASEGLSTVVLDKVGPGGQAGGSSKIENFIGFPSGLTGNDLATRGILQMLKFGARMVAPVTVKKIVPRAAGERYHQLHLDCEAVIKARVVLIATGVKWKKLEVPGAHRFERAGVYYTCTAIEALLHEDEDVVVIGAGNSAGQAAMFLAECCPKRTVHMLCRSTLGPSMSEYLTQRIRNAKNITVHEGAQATAIHGNNSGRIESISISDKTGERNLPATAVFVFIGADPATDWLPPELCLDERGFVMTGAQVVSADRWPVSNREPCPLETSIPGVLAAGDVRSGSTKRVGFAVGDGSQAVSCFHTLLTMDEEYAVPVGV